MDYFLKASAVLFIFYACYQLFLEKETFFQANRWFLLSGLIVACFIPLVVIPIYIEYTVTNTTNVAINYDSLSPSQLIIDEPFDYFQLIIWTYFAGILFFFGKLIVDLLSLRNVLKSSKTKSLGRFKILETNQTIAPFSFFDCIIYNPKQFEDDELQHIINHEIVHTQQWHSIDTIVSQLACILFWFNPIVWLYKKALQQNLEFIADQKAQLVSICEKSYQTVLLKTSVQNHQLSITNNFYTSLIKKRIVMLHKSKSNKIKHLKLVFVCPLLALFMMSFNTEEVYVENPLEIEATKDLFQTEDIEQIFTKDMSDEDFIVIKKKLADKGVTFDYSGIKRDKNENITAIKTEFEYNGNNGTYNINSDKAMEPFIFQSNDGAFVVGNFTDKTPKIYTTHNGKTKIQSSGSSNVYVIEEVNKDSQVEHQKTNDVISTSGNTAKSWTNGDGEKISTHTSESGNSYTYTTQSDEPLFIINGKIVEKSLFEDVDSDDIKSIFVLKNKMATEKYGDRGKNGVVILKTKDSPKWVIGNSVKVETFEIDSIDHSINYKFANPQDTKTNSNITYEFTQYNKDHSNPLILLDGNVISDNSLKDMNPDNIESLTVVKDNSAIKSYGEKGKNGVIIIKTKSPTLLSGENKPKINKKIDKNYSIAISEVSYTDDYGNLEMIEFIVSKNSSDAFLEKQMKDLKTIGIDAKFSKIKRNNSGEITSIKISLEDNNGRKSSASWKEKDQAIPDIVMGKSKDDKLFVRAIGN